MSGGQNEHFAAGFKRISYLEGKIFFNNIIQAEISYISSSLELRKSKVLKYGSVDVNLL